MKSLNIYLVLLIATLVAMSACRKTVEPDNLPPNFASPNEPDSVRSSLLTFLQIPQFSGTWKINTPDTMRQGGPIRITLANGMVSYSGNSLLPFFSALVFHYHTDVYTKSQRSISSWSCSTKTIADITLRGKTNPAGYPDSLASWKEEYFEFKSQVPSPFTTPLVIDSVDYYLWERIQVDQVYAPGLQNGTWVIAEDRERISYAEYRKTVPKGDALYYLYSSRILRSTIQIDSYDSLRYRASGRFSFRVIGSLTNDVIDMRDGVFTNVKVIRTIRYLAE